MAAPSRPPVDPFAAAIAMLAARACSVAEVKEKLRRRGFAAGAIDETVVRLKKLGFLDDRKLAERYASSLVRNRAFGRHRVERELKARRVDPRAVRPALDQAFEENDESALLQRALDQKLRSLRLPLTRTRLASLYNSLRRRGFRSDDIMKAVSARPELGRAAEETPMESPEE